MSFNFSKSAILFSFFTIFSFVVFVLSKQNFAFFRISTIFFIFMLFLLLKRKKRVNLLFFTLLLLLIFNLLIFDETNSFKKIFLFLFFLSVLLLNAIKFESFHYKIRKSFNVIYYFHLFISLLYLAVSNPLPRFYAYSSSSTTYAVYLCVIYFLFISESKKTKPLHFLLNLILLYLSGTRSILLLFVVLNLAAHFIIPRFKSLSYRKISVLQLPLIIFIFPVLSLFSQYDVKIGSRDLFDKSTSTRLLLIGNQVEEVKNYDLKTFFFGNGIDSNLEVGSIERDHGQHNDFFLLLHDYGIIFCLLFLWFIVSKVNDDRTYCISTVYFIGFFHNMIYDIFILSLIIICSLSYKKHV